MIHQRAAGVPALLRQNSRTNGLVIRNPPRSRAFRDPQYLVGLRPVTLDRFLIRARFSSQGSQRRRTAPAATLKYRELIFGSSVLISLVFGYFYFTDTRAGIHRWAVVPALQFLHDDAERAHTQGTASLKTLYKLGLHPRERGDPDRTGDLSIEVFGHRIKNPIGTSAGIDKHAEIPSALLELGPSIIEIGAVTPKPQEGNPKPRVFRLASQKALVNRYGFNSEGAEAVAARLRKRVRRYAYAIGLGKGELAEQLVLDGEAGVPAGSLTDGKLMAVQVAKNKSTSEKDIEAVKDDYVYCVKRLAKYADIIVVNVSSPNTPGLRTLQNVGPLTSILTSVVEAASKTQRRTKPSVMVKVSPDEDSDDQVSGICEAIWESGVQGVIVANSTLQRPEPLPRGSVLPEVESRLLQEQGGYSGPQLFDRTLALVKKYRSVLDRGPQRSYSDQEGKFTAQPSAEGSSDSTSSAAAGQTSQPLFQLPERHKTSPSSNTDSQQPPRGEGSFGPERKVIFASGGITNGKQALEVLDAGASVAMMYTAIVYGGVGTITRVKDEMRSEKRHRRLADEH